MKSTNTTPSQENYIEWIYRLSAAGPVRSGQLAEKLGVTRPSATRAIASLVKKRLVIHKPYGEIRLTQEGRNLGRAIVRRDDCLTDLLVTVLGMTPESADPEVHRLEHVLSDDVLPRLEALVNFATSSDAWLRRLHYRIANTSQEPRGTPAFVAGCSGIHQGEPSEKTS